MKASGLDEAAVEWETNGWRGLQLRCDVREAADNKAVVEAVEKAFGRIDILVNNAGVAGGARVEQLSEEAWDLNMDVNLKGTFLMCQAVIPVMKRQRSGRILNAASFAATARRQASRSLCTPHRAPRHRHSLAEKRHQPRRTGRPSNNGCHPLRVTAALRMSSVIRRASG